MLLCEPLSFTALLWTDYVCVCMCVLKAAVAACSHTEAYSRNPGLCLCSTWGPNWICAWIPPNSHALSKDTGWEPFKMSSLAWNTTRPVRIQCMHLNKQAEYVRKCHRAKDQVMLLILSHHVH